MLDGHHRAVNDARATAKVFLELLARARRTSYGELAEMDRILVGSDYSLGQLIKGFHAIEAGPEGVYVAPPLPDNRIGRWDGEQTEETSEDHVCDDIASFFADDSALANIIDGYQSRSGQIKMAEMVDRTLNKGGILLAEAGTGTGKSFAYLAPSLLHARSGGSRVIVSTFTRHLQTQLFQKDLPALNEALGGGFRACLLKGRGNYICKRRFDIAVADPDNLEPTEKIGALSLVRWLQVTRTGDISEIPNFYRIIPRSLWAKCTAETGFCTARVCRKSGNCFLHRIRSSAMSSHVVLVNHALLFSDLAAGGGVLGPYSKVVFDEAHQVEKVAASHMGIDYSHTQLHGILYRLLDASGKHGLLLRFVKYAETLYPPLSTGDTQKKNPLEKAIEGVQTSLETGSRFNEALNSLLRDKSGYGNDYGQRVRYREGKKLLDSILEQVEAHSNSLGSTAKALNNLCDDIDEEGFPLDGGDDLAGELRRLFGEVKTLKSCFDTLTGEGDADFVFWYDIPSNPQWPIRLYAAPVDVGAVLQEDFYPKLDSTIFTSATMTVDDSFNYISYRLGVEEEFDSDIFESPFDMRRQLYIAIPDFLGSPKGNVERFTKEVANLTSTLALKQKSGTLALFTSSRMLRDAYSLVKPSFQTHGRMLLGQGLDGGQADLLERFKLYKDSVLFGLNSFWEGIDVPGDALELLIIARLPFDVPSDPLVEARCELIEEDGGNPFMEYSVPEAALKLKQGIGRLIRTTEDVGVAVICDARIIRSRWGKVILNSLPVTPIEYKHIDQLVDDIGGFLGSE